MLTYALIVWLAGSNISVEISHWSTVERCQSEAVEAIIQYEPYIAYVQCVPQREV